jgi:hypothetical protein
MKPHKTAISRSKLPQPTQYLITNNLIKGDCLDFGCGKCASLNSEIRIDSYDPFFQPLYPTKKYDTIVCNYVLNVVPPDVQDQIVSQIKELLNPYGVAYISVRRDIKEDYKTKDTEQFVVRLGEKSITKNSNFEMYRIVNTKAS